MLSLESYADVMAHITHFGGERSAEIRERLEIAERMWAKSDAHWLAALSADADSEGKELVLAFGTRFVASSDTLERESPTIESLAPLLPSAGSARPAEFVSVDETALGVFAAIDASLPFGEEPSPEFVLALSNSIAADPVAKREAEDLIGMTSFLPALPSDDGPTLPFGAVAAPDLDETPPPELTLEQFASLAAELARAGTKDASGAEAECVLARYGLTGRQYESLRQTWERRFEQHPQERRHYHQLLTQYATWLEQRGG